MSEGGNGGGGEGGGNNAGGGGGGGGRTVPYDRFQQVVQARNTLQGRVSELESELQGLSEKAATVDTLSASLEDWKLKAAAAEAKFGTYTEISGALGSADPDVVDLVETQYKKLPEKDRPGRVDWLKGLKEKPDDAPAVLRPFLGTSPSDAGGEGGGGGAGGKKPKNVGGGGTPPGSQGGVTAEQIREAKNKGVKTGDWSSYKALKKRMAGG